MSNSKPWGGIGAWAAEAERAEAEEAEAEAAAAKAAPTPAESQSFPSLKEAVSTKSKKKKMSLSEFTMGSYSSTSSSAAGGGGLTPDEMRRLPTGPKQRSAEEMQQGRLGGGFSNYGRSGPPPRIRDDTDGSWSGGGGGGGGGGRRSYGGFDEDRRGPPPRVTDFDQPSRADEVENWALAKKSLPSFDSGRQNQNQNQNRYASLGGGSRADEVDNWTAGKKPIQPRSSNFGSGYRDSGPEPDRWGRGVGVGGGGGGGGGFREVERERPRLVLDPPKGETGLSEPVKTNRSNPFGEARPREEVLAEKGLDWKKLDSEIEAKKVTSRPTSGHSSRPSSAQSTRSEGVENVVVKPRPKVNPFGDAKPREVLLEERGEDWRKIDLQLEHRRVDRPETEEEKMLKEEIDHLKEHAKEFTMKANRESLQGSSEDQTSINDIILQKENQLETLIRDLDDKVRFGQKAIERPGSGSSRAAGFPERPPSQSGSFEESRNMEFMDRPRSRGTADVWTRPVDERRAFQGGRERGFLGSRDLDRPRSRERW